MPQARSNFCFPVPEQTEENNILDMVTLYLQHTFNIMMDEQTGTYNQGYYIPCNFLNLIFFSQQISQSGNENVWCHRGGSYQLCVFHCQRYCCRYVMKVSLFGFKACSFSDEMMSQVILCVLLSLTYPLKPPNQHWSNTGNSCKVWYILFCALELSCWIQMIKNT